MIIPIYGEKLFDKIQHPFIIKTFSKLGIEGNFLNLIKDTNKNPTVNITLNGKNLEAFLLKWNW